jgi:precorrin-2 dehydrogenase/sirohydrochlorin ferrochelatase
MSTKLYFPVNLDLNARHCLVIGGGDIAAGKARSLFDFGAKVTVISPACKPSMRRMITAGQCAYIEAKYHLKYLKGVFLVIAATNDSAVNARVAAACVQRNILVNVVDVPELCTFIVPSVVRRGPIVIGISTSGQSPMFAQQQRRKCEQCVTPAQGAFVSMLGKVRPRVQAKYPNMGTRKAVYANLLNSNVLPLLEKGQTAAARKLFYARLAADGIKM